MGTWVSMGSESFCIAWADGDWRCIGTCDGTEYTSNVCTVDPPLQNVEVIITCADEGSTMSVSVTGCTDSLSYQWQNSVGGSWQNITGATASTYLVPTEGVYRCRVVCGGITVYSDSCTAADTDKPLTCPEPKYDVLRAPNPISRMKWANGQKVDYLWELRSVDLMRGWSWPSHCDWGWMDQLFIYPCNEGGQRLGKDCRYWGHYSWANDTEGLDDYLLYEECFDGSGGTPTFKEGQYIMGIFHKNLSPEDSKDPCNGKTLPDGFPGPTPPGGNPYPPCYPTCWPDNGVGHGDRYMPKTKAILDSLGQPFHEAKGQSNQSKLIWTGYPPPPAKEPKSASPATAATYSIQRSDCVNEAVTSCTLTSTKKPIECPPNASEQDGICICDEGFVPIWNNGELTCYPECEDPNAELNADGECICKCGYLWSEAQQICVEECESAAPPGGDGNCEDGEDDPCQGVTCLPPRECVDGKCVCPEGTVDVGGLCMSDDRCENVLCPPNSTCYDGRCVCDEGFVLNPQGYCVRSETDDNCDDTDCISNATIQIKPGAGLGGGGSFRLNQACDKTIMLWVDPNAGTGVDDDCDENGQSQVCSCTAEIQALLDLIVDLKAQLEQLQDDADECLNRNDCDGNGGGLGAINKITAGDRITLDPAHGDLKLSDIKISAAGNTGPGVDIIYDPIFLDFETEQGPVDEPELRETDFDYMGSGGITEADSMNQYIIRDLWVSPQLTPADWPAEANAFFFELNWASSIRSGSPHLQDHPSFQLDTVAEVYASFQNKTLLEGGTFISGQEKQQNSDASHQLAFKMTPPTVMPRVKNSHYRVSKMNFATLDAVGTPPKFTQKISVKTYHYARTYLGLGRAKVIPVKVADLPAALNWIKPQLIEGEQTQDTYKVGPADIVRFQGNDLRQAVQQLQSSIEFVMEGGSPTGEIQELQTNLKQQIYSGSGTFEEIRDRLTALKATAYSLGVIGLTKLEKDAGVVWDNVANPK